MTTRLGLAAVAAIALTLAPAAGIPVFGDHGAAFAKGGGGGNGGGNGNGGDDYSGNGNSGKSGGNGKGASSRGYSGKSGSGKSKSAYSTGSGGSSKGRSAFTKSEHSSKVAKAAKAPPARKQQLEDEVAKNQHGKIASTLKGLNAAHASLTAYANASPNSRVGMIATYRAALLEERAALESQAAYLETLTGFATEDATASPEDVLAALQALDTDGATFTEEDVYAALAELNPDATEEELADLYAGLEGIVEADDALAELDNKVDEALTAALRGQTLEEDTPAWDAFHEMLRLDEPLPEPNHSTEAEEAVIEDQILDEVDSILGEDTAEVE